MYYCNLKNDEAIILRKLQASETCVYVYIYTEKMIGGNQFYTCTLPPLPKINSICAPGHRRRIGFSTVVGK